MLINVQMPTIVGILTFISMLNATSESLKARQVGIFKQFSYYKQSKFHAHLSWAWKKFHNLGIRTDVMSSLICARTVCIDNQQVTKFTTSRQRVKKTQDYKNLSWVWGWDRKICPEDHCLASRGLPSDDKQWWWETNFCIPSLHD